MGMSGVPVGVGGVVQHFYADATAVNQLVTANVVTKKRHSTKEDDDYEDDEELDEEFENEFGRHRRSRGPSKKKKSRRGGDEDDYDAMTRKKFQDISPIPPGGIEPPPRKKGQGNLTDSRKLLLQINSWLVSTLQLKDGFGAHDFVDLSEFLRSVCPDTITVYVDTERNPNVLKINLINLENLRKVKVEDRNWIYQYIVTRVDIICTTAVGADPTDPNAGIKVPKTVMGGDKGDKPSSSSHYPFPSPLPPHPPLPPLPRSFAAVIASAPRARRPCRRRSSS